MSTNIPKLIEFYSYIKIPEINPDNIKELLDYAEKQADEEITLLAFSDILHCAKGAITSQIRTSPVPQTELFRLLGVLETVESLTKDRILLYEFAEVSDVPMAKDIIDCIYHNSGIRDEQIAEKLDVDYNNEHYIKSFKIALDKLLDKGFMTFSRPGKWPYYYLTEKGNQYYEDYILPF